MPEYSKMTATLGGTPTPPGDCSLNCVKRAIKRSMLAFEFNSVAQTSQRFGQCWIERG